MLNEPGAGGADQSMPDGTQPSLGGWNRFQITVKQLPEFVKKLKNKDGSKNFFMTTDY